MTKMQIKIGKTILKKPILGASGCAGWGEEISAFNDFNTIGGFVTKSITLNEKTGNDMPRIHETCGGMLNSIGLENLGVKHFIEKKLPEIKNYACAVFLNLAPFSKNDLIEMIKLLNEHESFSGYEVNISCPNVAHGGVSFNSSIEQAESIIKGARNLTDKTLILKLSPAFNISFDIAKMAEDEGFDAISFTNTYIGTAIDIKQRKFKFANKQAGLSGPAIKPISLWNVYRMSRHVKIPVIGIGGIRTLDDVLEYLIAGASAVQVGTALLIDPDILETLSADLENYLNEEKIDDIKALIGSIRE